MWIFLAAVVLLLVAGLWIAGSKRSGTVETQIFTRTQQSLAVTALPVGYTVPTGPLPKFDVSEIDYLNGVSQSLVSTLKTFKFIGVDIEESRSSSFAGKICLIQISTPAKTYIIDTISNRDSIPALNSVFMDPNITKVFHGCSNDTQWLQRDFKILCVNVFDRQLAAKHLKMTKLGLNHLWDRYCEFQMPSEYKKQMQISDWELRPLTKEQIEYAAMDSFYLVYLMKVLLQELNDEFVLKIRKETNQVCLEPYELKMNSDYYSKLFQEHFGSEPEAIPLQVFSSLLKFFSQFANSNGKTLEEVVKVSTVVEITKGLPKSSSELAILLPDTQFQEVYKEILEIIESNQTQVVSKSQQNSILRQQKKQERYKTFLKKYTISGKVFENCQIQLPNGEILCYANQKKTKWYLDRNLATTISESPPIIRLNFEPNFKSDLNEEDRKLFKNEKKNECVVCGSAQSFLRYRVVPLLYRQYFPEDCKGLCRHDVLLLCASCHELANKHAESFKRTIAEEFSVPLNAYTPAKKFKEQLMGIRKVCVSYKKNFKKIPEERKLELLKQISEFLKNFEGILKELCEMDVEEVVEIMVNEKKFKEVLAMAGDVDWKCEEGDMHGKMVMEKVKDVKEFVFRWKKNFVDKMQPPYLPGSWKQFQE